MGTVKMKKSKVVRRPKKASPDGKKVDSGEKKKSVQEDRPVDTFSPPTVKDMNGVDRIALTREHLLQAELYLSQIAALVIESKSLHNEAALREQEAILTVRSLRQEAMDRERKSVEKRAEADRFWIEMSGLYGINFKNAGYDDQTGIITVDPRAGEEERN